MKYRAAALIVSFFLLVLIPTALHSQAPDTIWTRMYGGSGSESADFVFESPWGEYIIGGTTDATPMQKTNFYVVCTDLEGDTIWSEIYGESDRWNRLECMKATSDGCYVILGTRAQDFPYDNYVDMYLVKIDSDGNVVWSNTIGDAFSSEWPWWMDITSDGGFIIVGDLSSISEDDEIYIVKASSTGNLQWDRTYDWEYSDYPGQVVACSDGSYMVAGQSQSIHPGGDHYDHDMFLFKLSASGDSIWVKGYGEDFPWYEGCSYLCQTSDGGFLMSGFKSLYDVNYDDIYAVRTNSDGDVIWSSWLEMEGHDGAGCPVETYDGGFILPVSFAFKDAYLMKFNDIGDTLWTKSWKDTLHGKVINVVQQTADGGFIAAGAKYYYGFDMYLARLSPDPGLNFESFHHSDLNLPITSDFLTEDIINVDISEKSLQSMALYDVQVMIDTILHDNVGNLELYLTHNGLTDTLMFHAGDDGDNIFRTTFSDASVVPIANGAAPFAGIFQPYNPLSNFRSMDPNGEWAFGIYDDGSGVGGTLESWGLNLMFEIVTGLDDNTAEKPERYHLGQNYPNPFNPRTIIEYSVPSKALVRIEIFNILGQKITTLVDEVKESGDFRIIWDGKSSFGKPAASGIYLYRLQVGDFIDSKKMVLLK